MASEYGLNFGFRVSDETRRSSFGRVRTPKSGPALRIGTAVELNPDDPMYLRPVDAARMGAADFTWGPTAGILVQEEEHLRSVYGAEYFDSFDIGVAQHNRLSVITSGAGTKVWFKNTTQQVRADGRVIPAVSMFTTAGMAVGVAVTWDGAAMRWAPAAGANPNDATSIGVCSYYNASAGLVEVFLTH
jgi:hypothetical protein